jgi:hypothetical protein
VIVTAAYVAEPSPAAALHLVTASCFLHPEVAFWALFKFLSADELHKLLIVLILFVSDFILFASLAPMIENSAVEAIVLSTMLALKRGITFKEEKHVLATCGWTPRCVLLSIYYLIN